MGGDRDGHPHVTPEVTQQTIGWLRDAAIEQHLKICDQLIESLSISVRQAQGCSLLYEPIAAACAEHPELEALLERIAPLETPRRWLRIVAWRLEQTGRVTLDGDDSSSRNGSSGAYANVQELLADVDRLREVLEASGDQEVVSAEVQAWIDQIRVFGLHTARLDLRQHSELYTGVMEELWRAIGLLKADEELTEDRRCDLLESSLAIRHQHLSDRPLARGGRDLGIVPCTASFGPPVWHGMSWRACHQHDTKTERPSDSPLAVEVERTSGRW